MTGMVYRHPGVLANMASTLDITSGGRLELGMGAGWNEEECDAFGIELGTIGERFDRFEEGLAVIESLLTNERTTFDGTYYRLTEAMNHPKPLQRPLPDLHRRAWQEANIAACGSLRTPLELRRARHGGVRRVQGGAPRGLRVDRARPPGDHVQAHSPATRETTMRFRPASAAMEAAGADLVIVSVPKTATPSAVAQTRPL